MGKRELLLILAFAAIGIVLYQLSAPPGTSNSRFNFGQLIESAKREIQGNQARAERKTETTEPIGTDVDEIRLQNVPTVTLVGEDRDDLQLELNVTSTGFDTAEAERLARETTLRLDASGRVVTLAIEYPEAGRQSASLVVRLPSRLRARLQGARGDTRVTDVAALYLDGTRGDVVVERVAGAIEGNHVGGEVRLSDVGDVSLTARASDLRIDRVRGDTRLDITGGTVEAASIGGRFELDGRPSEAAVSAIGGTARVNVRGGRVALRGVGNEVRFDGRSTDFELALERPAAVTAIATGGSIRFVAPATGGFTLDAVASEGRVRVTDLDVPVTDTGPGQRASAAVRGGGPTVALRATDGSIDIRATTTR